MTSGAELTLPQLNEADVEFGSGAAPSTDSGVAKTASDMAQLYDVPVTVSAVLGHVRLPIAELLKLGPGTVVELDRKVGEAIDILVNDRLVARGEVVLVDDRLGVTMTEIVRPAA